MDEYYRILESLPPALRTPLAKLDAHYAPHIQEIRLRLGQPIQFTIRGRLCPAAKFLPGTGLPAALETDTLRDCFLQLCRRSVYAYEDELKQGYFTVQGGCRIGVAGCRGPGGFSAVTSLNLRIARWLTCPLPPELEALTVAPTGGLLLAGPPGSGKTTLLRSLVQKLCEGDALVSVIDERGELMACEAGSLPRAAQIRCDVYARCTKAEGIAMALRCMNPQVIVCDELGTPGDAEAVAQGVASGVVFFATVHCDDPAGLRKKPALTALLDTGAFAAARHAAFTFGRDGRRLCRRCPRREQPPPTAQLCPPAYIPGRAAGRTGVHRTGAITPRSAGPGVCRFLSRTGGEPVRADTACLYAGRIAAGGTVEPFRRRGGSAPDGLCRAAPPGFAL